MQPFFDWILTVNLILSTAVFYVAARIYLVPKLDKLKPQSVLLPILLLHSFRQLGLMFLARVHWGQGHTRHILCAVWR